jgi:hypothetical protein
MAMGSPERVSDVWSIVHAERAALIHDLEGLGDKQWEQPSLLRGVDGP